MISERRKAALAEVIGRCGMILIEDDIHAFLSAGILKDYAGPVSRFLPEQSVYISGTSKPLCSGLRVAYLVFGDRFREQIHSAIFNVNDFWMRESVSIIQTVSCAGPARSSVSCALPLPL